MPEIIISSANELTAASSTLPANARYVPPAPSKDVTVVLMQPGVPSTAEEISAVRERYRSA